MHPALRSVPLLLLLAAPAAAAPTRAYVVTTDFSTGGLSVINTTTFGAANDVNSAHSDARERWFDGNLYIVNRLGADNIQVVNGTTYANVFQFSTGNGSNPGDIALVSPTKAYVALYEKTGLLVVNPQTGATITTISLAAFADADGIPEMDRLALWGPWLFVSVQRLNRNAGFTPTDHSDVVVIDTRTDQVHDVDPGTAGVQSIVLPLKNPVTSFVLDRPSRRLLVGCAGFYVSVDGGVAAIDPATHQSLGVVATEAALGGDLSDIEWLSSTQAYAIVSDNSFNTLVVRWNPTTGLSAGTVFNPGGFSIPDCALDGAGRLWVCHNDFSGPGVRIYSTATDLLIGGPIDTGLPPYQIAFDAARSEVGVPSHEIAALELAGPWPNPASTTARFALRLAAPTAARVDVFDPAGRRVRAIAQRTMPAGTTALEWDLRDGAGARVRAGVYLVRVEAAGAITSCRVVVTE